jgi:membrane-bound ClpP family serine protease
MWPLVCLILGLILIFAEVFIPSGGILGLLSTGLLILSLWLAFSESTALGIKFLATLAILVPGAVIAAVQVWPHTPMGKWMILRPPSEEEIEPAPAVASGGTRLEYLVGQYGRAVTPLRPAGMVDFQGRRVDGLAEEGLISSGTLVKAVQVRAGQMIVRVATDELTFEDLVEDAPPA